MAKLRVQPQQAIIDGFKGKIDFYVYKGIPVVRRWPRSPGHNRSPAVQAQWIPFTEAVKLWATLPEEVKAAYEEMALGQPLTARDLFTQSYIKGNLEAETWRIPEMIQGARVYNNAHLSIPNAVWTALTFNSERYDTDSIHDPAVNPSRLTCKTPGVYSIIANARFATNATGVRGLRLLINGAILSGHVLNASFGTYPLRSFVSTLWALNIGDYVEVQAWQNSGGALNVEYDPSYSPEFMMQRLS